MGSGLLPRNLVLQTDPLCTPSIHLEGYTLRWGQGTQIMVETDTSFNRAREGRVVWPEPLSLAAPHVAIGS